MAPNESAPVPRPRVANAPLDGVRVRRHDCRLEGCAPDPCDTQSRRSLSRSLSATGSTVSTVGSCTLRVGLTLAKARRARSPGSPRERGAYRSRRESSRRHVGAASAVTPVLSTDVCKPTIDGSKNGYPRRLGALRGAFPTRRESSRFHAEMLASASGPTSQRHFLLREHRARVPLALRRRAPAFPCRACLVSARGGRSREVLGDPARERRGT